MRHHQIELDFHALIRTGDQLNGEQINWIQDEEAKSSCGLAWSIQLQEREEERAKGEGGGKVCVCVRERDRERESLTVN